MADLPRLPRTAASDGCRRYALTNQSLGAKGRRAADAGLYWDDVNTARPLVVAARDLGWWRRRRAERALLAAFGPTVVRMAETYDGHDAGWLSAAVHKWGEIAPYPYDTAYRTGKPEDTDRLDVLLDKLVKL